MTPELEALARRLEEVEKQIAHLGALVVEQSDTERAVVAQNFVVTDTRGVRRAELGLVIPAGETEVRPWLGLFDTDGNPRACLGLEEKGVFFELFNGKHKALHVGVDDDGPGIMLLDANGKPSVHVGVDENGPAITLLDANGKPSALVGVSEDGPWISLHSPSGKPRVKLGFSPSGSTTLYMGDTEGASAKLAVDSDGASLQFGKDNKVFWSAP
jgi:hypothetical protein